MYVRTLSPAYDVVIVGAGPAGLSAALVLGRACRRVLLCDDGRPRSWAALTREDFDRNLRLRGAEAAHRRRLSRDRVLDRPPTSP